MTVLADPPDPTAPITDGEGADPTFGGQSIRRNLVAGFLLQIANYAFPLVLLPYLTRTLGLAGFGGYIFVINLIGYCSVIVEWGFALGAKRRVAQMRQDRQALADIFWTTLAARLLLVLPAGLALGVVALAVPGPGMAPLVLLGLISLVGTAFTSDWYFGGLERMTIVTVATIVARAFQLIGTLLFVSGPGDVPIAVALWGGTTLFAALATLLGARRLLPGGRPRFAPRAALALIVEERHLFLSQSAVVIYTSSAPVVLGFVAGAAAVGLYGGAERLAKAALALVAQVSNVMFPRLAAIHANAPEQFVPTLRRVALFQLGGMALATAGLLVLAGPIVRIMLGPDYGAAVPVLRWLALLPLIIGANNLLGIQLMVPLGMQADLFRITLASAVAFLILLFTLGHYRGAVGAAIAIVATELLVVLLQVRTLRIKQPAIWRALIAREGV